MTTAYSITTQDGFFRAVSPDGENITPGHVWASESEARRQAGLTGARELLCDFCKAPARGHYQVDGSGCSALCAGCFRSKYAGSWTYVGNGCWQAHGYAS